MTFLPPSYRYRYNKKGELIETPYNWAFGKEKRPQLGSKEPFSHLEKKRSMSKPAQWLLWARAGDEIAEVKLLMHVTKTIQQHAAANCWGINTADGRAIVFARIILWKYIHDEDYGDNKSAKMLGIESSAWRRHWRPKIELVEEWLVKLSKEIEGYK